MIQDCLYVKNMTQSCQSGGWRSRPQERDWPVPRPRGRERHGGKASGVWDISNYQIVCGYPVNVKKVQIFHLPGRMTGKDILRGLVSGRAVQPNIGIRSALSAFASRPRPCLSPSISLVAISTCVPLPSSQDIGILPCRRPLHRTDGRFN